MPVGAPRVGTIYDIMQMLFSEEEAEIGSKMPQKPASLNKVAQYVGMNPDTLRPKLEAMAERGLVFDFVNPDTGKTYYLLAPTVVGFFEFSLMTRRTDIDQKQLAALFDDYMNNHTEFAHNAFRGKTQFGRAMVAETALTQEQQRGILPYESATTFIEEAHTYSITMCYCRHKGELMGHPCEAPLDICMSLDASAEYLIRHNLARPAEKPEMLEKLEQARELGLVQMGDNVKKEPNFICNCCGCHCGVLLGFNNHGIKFPMNSSNYMAVIDPDACKGCGKCAERCPIDAITLTEYTREDGKKRKRAKVDEKICLGCGACHRGCTFDALRMESRKERVFTPENTIERVMAMSLERGTIGNLMFDDDRRADHKFFRAFIGAAANLPPTRQLMLNEALRSRFLEFFMKQATSGGRKSKGA